MLHFLRGAQEGERGGWIKIYTKGIWRDEHRQWLKQRLNTCMLFTWLLLFAKNLHKPS